MIVTGMVFTYDLSENVGLTEAGRTYVQAHAATTLDGLQDYDEALLRALVMICTHQTPLGLVGLRA